jgi:hypothetical protein
MSWLAVLLSACCVLIGVMAIANFVFGLVVAYGYMRGIRCTEQDDFSFALGMIFLAAPLCSALSLICWWASGRIAG